MNKFSNAYQPTCIDCTEWRECWPDDSLKPEGAEHFPCDDFEWIKDEYARVDSEEASERFREILDILVKRDEEIPF